MNFVACIISLDDRSGHHGQLGKCGFGEEASHERFFSELHGERITIDMFGEHQDFLHDY